MTTFHQIEGTLLVDNGAPAAVTCGYEFESPQELRISGGSDSSGNDRVRFRDISN